MALTTNDLTVADPAPSTSATRQADSPLPVLYIRRKRLGNPFRMPPPSEKYVFPEVSDEVRTRTPQQVREAMRRRVDRWFSAMFKALPDDIRREDKVACVFGIRGWRVVGRVADSTKPVHAWVLNHPTDGWVLYVDAPRDGDKHPGWKAPTAGPLRYPLLRWGTDLADLLDQQTVMPTPRAKYSAVYVLCRHALTMLSATERQAVEFLLALSDFPLGTMLELADETDLTVDG